MAEAWSLGRKTGAVGATPEELHSGREQAHGGLPQAAVDPDVFLDRGNGAGSDASPGRRPARNAAAHQSRLGRVIDGPEVRPRVGFAPWTDDLLRRYRRVMVARVADGKRPAGELEALVGRQVEAGHALHDFADTPEIADH